MNKRICANCGHCSDAGVYCLELNIETDWDSTCPAWREETCEENQSKCDWVKSAVAALTR